MTSAPGDADRTPAREADALLDAFDKGQPGAGAALYDRLFPVVDATLFRVLGRREQDHADLVQSAFEQIVGTLARRKFARECTLDGWAAVIACHVGLNALRARRRERGVLDSNQRGASDGPTVEAPFPVRPEAHIEARSEVAVLRRLLADMDGDRVTALLLHAMGYDLVEIARLTGVSVAAAQSRLSRGRRELRRRFEQEPTARRDGTQGGEEGQ